MMDARGLAGCFNVSSLALVVVLGVRMIGAHTTCKSMCLWVFCVRGCEIGDVVDTNPSAAVETDLTAAL